MDRALQQVEAERDRLRREIDEAVMLAECPGVSSLKDLAEELAHRAQRILEGERALEQAACLVERASLPDTYSEPALVELAREIRALGHVEKGRAAVVEATVWSYPIERTHEQPVRLPRGAKVLHAAMQGGTLTLWAEVNPGTPTARSTIYVVGTGHGVPKGSRYINTVHDDPFVWHIYEGCADGS